MRGKVSSVTGIADHEANIMKNSKNPETLINTGFQLGNTWQHPKSPQNEAVNIAEAPKTAASAVPEASLGEDKYLSYLLTIIIVTIFFAFIQEIENIFLIPEYLFCRGSSSGFGFPGMEPDHSKRLRFTPVFLRKYKFTFALKCYILMYRTGSLDFGINTETWTATGNMAVPGESGRGNKAGTALSEIIRIKGGMVQWHY